MDRKTRWAIKAGTMLIRALASTWRYRVRGLEHLQTLRDARQPFIFSLWHGQLLPLLWHHRRQGIAVLISEHRDGEMIAQVAESLGYQTVRGSTTRGGGRALIGLVRELNSGRDVAVTPDGPRGPARTYAPGALVAAQRSGAPILPIAAYAASAWRLKSWDKFLIPKPFATVAVAYSAAQTISADTPRDAAGDEQVSRMQAIMAATEQRALGSASHVDDDV